MRTREEVVHAFTPVNPKFITPQQTQELQLLQNAFMDLATEVLRLVPESADRTAAMRKILEAKLTCIQAITHLKKEEKNGDKKEVQKGHS